MTENECKTPIGCFTFTLYHNIFCNKMDWRFFLFSWDYKNFRNELFSVPCFLSIRLVIGHKTPHNISHFLLEVLAGRYSSYKFCQPMLFIQTNAANVKWFLLIPVRKNILLWIGRKGRGKKKLYLLKCCILLIFLHLCWDPLLKRENSATSGKNLQKINLS